MRTLGRIILLLFIIVPALILVQRLWDSLHWNELAAMLSGRIENAQPSTCYLAMDAQWLEFRLSGMGKAMRVRTNAVVVSDNVRRADQEWWYAFEYQLLDAKGGIMRQGVYHHRTRLTRLQGSESGQPMSRTFLLDPNLVPLDGKSMVLYFDSEKPPTGLRIRPLQYDLEVTLLMFRVYEKTPTPNHQLGYLWQRLPESKKTRMARSSIFGNEFLMEKEKQNLLRYQWKAVGPMGVQDAQYRLLKLYIAHELNGLEIQENPIPYGLYSDRVIRGMIPVPEGKWQIKLNVVRLSADTGPSQDVRVHWYGRGITKRWQTRIPAASGTYTLERSVHGGLLEVIAPSPLVMRVWGRRGDARVELTPEPLRVRSYVTNASGPLSIDIDHIAGQSTPFRIDIRSRMLVGEEAVARMLSYEFVDELGRQIEQGRIPIHQQFSNYDRLLIEEPGTNLSEAARYYFDLPPRVAKIRFSSQQELLLTAYTRPPAMVRKVRVPEDYHATRDDFERQPAWFLKRPNDDVRLRREFRSLVIILQPRPPESDPRLFEGDYDWQPYQPSGNWRARHLLIPRREDIPVRDQSIAAVYREVGSGRPIDLRFRGLPGHRDVRPTLLFLREQTPPLDIRVKLGERLHSAAQIAGRQGELKLPPVSPGIDSRTIASPEPVRWVINHADGEVPAYLRRLGMYLNDQGLEYEYLKELGQSEVLTGELYTRDIDRCLLHVTITSDTQSDPGPRQEWTFRNRLFDLRQDSDQAVPLLNSGKPPLNGGQRFVLPLGSDLPPGKYRIRFMIEDAQEGYLTLYRLTPGRTELRTFTKETVNDQTADL